MKLIKQFINIWLKTVKKNFGDSGYDGENIKEKMINYFVNIPLIFLLFIIFGSIFGWIRDILFR